MIWVGREVGSQQSIAVNYACAVEARKNAQIPFQM